MIMKRAMISEKFPRKEGEMKRHHFLISAAVLAVMLTGPALLSISGGDEKAGEKSLEAQPPISFDLRLPYTVKHKISQKIQADNQMLLGLFDQLRKMPLDNDDNITKAAQKLKEIFGSTYLTRPRLIMDDGKLPYDGWKANINALKELVKTDTGIQIRSIEVQVFYVPYAGAPNPKVDTDMKLLIRTTVIMGAHNDFFEGWLCHRRICDPIPCEEGI
jgi:hypothetical protein